MQVLSPYRNISFILILLCICSGSALFAQSAKSKSDSATRARQHVLDSTRNAQKAILDASRNTQKAKIDSTRAAQQHAMEQSRNVRQHSLDSVKSIRQHITDSLGRIRKYRESKHYKDSVTRSREQKVNTLRAAQKAKIDALKANQKRISDSTIAVRKRSTDSLKLIQKRRADSLGAIRKYRESKRFKDSVIIVRRVKMDALKAQRKSYNDSVFAVRKKTIDSAKAERKRLTDSTTAARTKMMDSVKAVRQKKVDSLAKAKADREKQVKAKEKKKSLLDDMKFELKLKQKRSKYTNNKMLKKKWSLPRKVVQNTFTRYNYYFNARKKMTEAELNMQRVAKDNFSNQIELFSFDPNRDSTLLLSDMDSIIQKASVGIQIHDPRSKWQDDLYLLLGEAYYYKGSYVNADASFRYIVAIRAKELKDKAARNAYSNKSVRGGRKEAPSVVEEDKKKLLDFLKHQSANNEALLWVARVATQSGKYEQAESVLDILGSDSKFPEDLKGRLALEKAFLALKQKNNREAATQLAIVSADKGQEYWIRRRAAFIAGQLYQDQHKYAESAQQFDKVIELQPKIEMDFYARKNKAYSMMLAGGNQEDAIASLKSMLNDGKYSAYNEQIYYILGQLSANSNNIADAENYLQKGINSPKTTRKQKASSFASLGNLYYKGGIWDKAKNAYDSAAHYGGASSEDTTVMVARRRAKVLDQVSTPERDIHIQDSLLTLSTLSEKEQKAVVRRYLRNLERQKADSANNAANASLNPATEPDASATDAASMTWYFSNPSLTQQGFNEFKRKWGNRPLVDNWQRAATISNSGSTANSPAGQSGADNAIADAGGSSDDLDMESRLLSYIPNTEAAKESTNLKIQRAYVDLSGAYIKALEDYPRANKTLDTFEKRYPVSLYSDEALYDRYLVALRQNDLKKAQEYSAQLQQKYPQSKWAAMVRPASDTGSGLNTATTATVANFYDETYQMLMQRQYPEVLVRSKEGRLRYQDETYANRFRIMEAIAYAGSGKYKVADTLLNEFIRTHQNDSLRVWADNVLRYVQDLKKADTLNKPPVDSLHPAVVAPGAASNATPLVNPATSPAITGSIPNRPLDSTSNVIVPATFTYKPSEEHYFVFYFTEMSSKAMGVKAALSDFNNQRFDSQSLTSNLEMLQQGKQGFIIVKRFANAAQAKIYFNEIKKTPAITREFTTTEFETFIISASNYLKLKADKNVQPYLVFYKARY